MVVSPALPHDRAREVELSDVLEADSTLKCRHHRKCTRPQSGADPAAVPHIAVDLVRLSAHDELAADRPTNDLVLDGGAA